MMWLEPDTAEWDLAWAALAAALEARRWGGIDGPDSTSGECWQYMGSSRDGRAEFRHRALSAADGARVYIRIGQPGTDADVKVIPYGPPIIAPAARVAPSIRFREEELGGVLGADNRVYSDADPGL